MSSSLSTLNSSFNCPHADWCYGDSSVDGECLAGWASINNLAVLYNSKDSASFHSGRWNSGSNPDLAFASTDSDTRLPDRSVLEKFSDSLHRPSLITPPRFALPLPSMPVTIEIPYGQVEPLHSFDETISPKLCYHPIYRTWIRSTRISATSSMVVETTTYRVGV